MEMNDPRGAPLSDEQEAWWYQLGMNEYERMMRKMQRERIAWVLLSWAIFIGSVALLAFLIWVGLVLFYAMFGS